MCLPFRGRARNKQLASPLRFLRLRAYRRQRKNSLALRLQDGSRIATNHRGKPAVGNARQLGGGGGGGGGARQSARLKHLKKKGMLHYAEKRRENLCRRAERLFGLKTAAAVLWLPYLASYCYRLAYVHTVWRGTWARACLQNNIA